MGLEKLMNRVLGIFKVYELPRTRWAGLATCGCEALGDPVVAKRALIGHFFHGMNVAASIRTSLHAIRTAEAVFRINEHDAVRSYEGCADGTDLGAGRICAVVAHLRNEEVLLAVLFSNWEALFAAVGRDYFGVGHIFVGDMVALNPGTEMSVGNIVFHRASANAVAATDAFWNVDEHSPPVIGHCVIGGGFWCSSQN